jgi:hypothetical protein
VSTAPSLARALFVPGTMGSALVDPSVPTDECRRILGDGRLAKHVLAWLGGGAASVLPGMARLDRLFASFVCALDPWQLWGANANGAVGTRRRRLGTAADPRRRGCRRAEGLLQGGRFRIHLPRFVVDLYNRTKAVFRESSGQGRRGLDVRQFRYDWRVDMCANAHALAQWIRQRWRANAEPIQATEEDRATVREAGTHKLVFGADGPPLHPGVELRKVELLGQPWAQHRLVTGAMILRLIGDHPYRPPERARTARPAPAGA